MSEAESRPLLQFLFQHAASPEFCCRLRWAPGTLAVWDNRCLMHLAINDYDGSRRLLHRTTVAGERPRGPSHLEIAKQLVRSGRRTYVDGPSRQFLCQVQADAGARPGAHRDANGAS